MIGFHGELKQPPFQRAAGFQSSAMLDETHSHVWLARLSCDFKSRLREMPFREE